MSWWVKEHIAVSDDETQQLCSIEADNQTSLPAADQTATAGFIIVRGSVAKDVSTGDEYIMNSSGTWIQQPSGVQLDLSGYATTQDLTDGLAAKVDTTAYEAGQAEQETEIGVVAAAGAKNILKHNNAAGYTLTTHGRTFEVMADGGIKITGDTPDSSYADFYVSGTWGGRDPILNAAENDLLLTLACADPLQTQNLYIRAVDRRTGSTASAATARLNQEAAFNFPVTTVLITVQPSVVLPTGGITVYPMIRRAEITDDTFAPYAPTNRELYEAKADKGSFDITIAGSPLVASEYSYSCIVIGDIVTICIRLVLGAELAINTSRNLFRIPSDYRPPVTCAGTGYADSKLRTFWVNTSGDIKIRIDEAIPSGAAINANFCYSYKAANWTTVTP